jgi:hypothetical protein
MCGERKKNVYMERYINCTEKMISPFFSLKFKVLFRLISVATLLDMATVQKMGVYCGSQN